MSISKVTRNYQVTLPRDIRDLKNIHVGDTLLFVNEGDRLDIVKMDRTILSKTAGLWSDLKETGVEHQRRLRKGWKKRKAD